MNKYVVKNVINERFILPKGILSAEIQFSSFGNAIAGKIIGNNYTQNMYENLKYTLPDSSASAYDQITIDTSGDTRVGQYTFSTTGFDADVNAIQLNFNEDLYVGGVFNNYNGTPVNYFCKLTKQLQIDTGFYLGTGFDAIVNCITVQPDDRILVGGSFSTFDTVHSARSIVRLLPSGNIDTSFSTGTGFNGTVRDIIVDGLGRIVVVGDFTTYNGTACNHIVRLMRDGSLDMSWPTGAGTGFNSSVRRIIFDRDTFSYYVVGNFTSYSANPVNRIVSLDINGLVNTNFIVGAGLNNIGLDIKFINRTQMIVVGNFTTYKGVAHNRIVKIDINGTVDPTFITTGFNSRANVIGVLPDGTFFVGGQFTLYDGVYHANRIIRLDGGAGIQKFNYLDGGFDNQVHAIAIKNNGNYYIGGDFTTFNSNISCNRILEILSGYPAVVQYVY